MEYENGKQAPLAVASPAPPEDMDGLISTGALPEPLRARSTAICRNGQHGLARCAAHEYRMLAAGHCHVALYNQLTAWDHAAGWLLHREAGGYAARFDGSPYKPTHRSGGLLYAPDAGSWHAAQSADGRGFRGLGKLSGRVRPVRVPFSGTPPRVIPGVIPTICGQPYGKLCNSRKNPCRTRACINRSKPAAGWRPAALSQGIQRLRARLFHLQGQQGVGARAARLIAAIGMPLRARRPRSDNPNTPSMKTPTSTASAAIRPALTRSTRSRGTVSPKRPHRA